MEEKNNNNDENELSIEQQNNTEESIPLTNDDSSALNSAETFSNIEQTEELNENIEQIAETKEDEKDTETTDSTEDIKQETDEEIIPAQPIVLDENETENEYTDKKDELITVRPVKFQKFENTEPVRSIKRNLDIMQDISMHISVELGKTKLSIKEVMDMKKGSIVELEKIAGEQVEIYVNEKLIAKGEVIVIEDKFGVRVTSTSIPKTTV